ncbi:MAG: ISKra4 family transposase [Desulfobacterales bacterium]|nr:ISKra4 family transposase [Desulfobacterales bacterium]
MKAKIVNQTSKSIKIEVEVPISNSMLRTEDDIQKVLNIAGTVMTLHALSTFDTDGSPLEKGKEKFTSKGKVPKKYQTPYGEIELSRHVYQSYKGGSTFCPLDNSARIIVGSTPKFSKQVSSKYAEGGSRRVQIDLEENHGRYISRSYIQDISNKVASGLKEKQEKWNYTLPISKEEVKSIGASLDGTCMILAQEGYREAMVGTIALYNAAGERLYTQYTASAPEYGKKTFFNTFRVELNTVSQYYPDAKIIGIADGAKENWTFLEEYTTEQILDYFHATEYLSLASDCIFRSKTKKEEWAGLMRHKLKHEKKGAIEILEEFKFHDGKKMSDKKRKDLDRCITYFKNHIHQMHYPDYIKLNYPIGSGVVEAACKVIIKQRLCNSGMKWKREGAGNVLKLRCINYSDTKWAQTWAKIDKYGL